MLRVVLALVVVFVVAGGVLALLDGRGTEPKALPQVSDEAAGRGLAGILAPSIPATDPTTETANQPNLLYALAFPNEDDEATGPSAVSNSELSRFTVSGQAHITFKVTTSALGSLGISQEITITYPRVEGDIYIDDNGAIDAALNSTLRLGAITSLSNNPTVNQIIEQALPDGKFPEIQLGIVSIKNLQWPPPDSGVQSLLLNSEFSINGVVRETPWQVTANFYPDRIEVVGDIGFKLSDYNWEQPAQSLFTFDDDITLRLDITLTKR